MRHVDAKTAGIVEWRERVSPDFASPRTRLFFRERVASPVDALAAVPGHNHQHVLALCIGVVDDEVADTPPRGVRCVDQAHGAIGATGRTIAQSMRDGRPRFAPPIKIRAAPRDRPRAESNRAWELLVGDQAVDRRTPEAGHSHDRGHAQKDRRRGVGAS